MERNKVPDVIVTTTDRIVAQINAIDEALAQEIFRLNKQESNDPGLNESTPEGARLSMQRALIYDKLRADATQKAVNAKNVLWGNKPV